MIRFYFSLIHPSDTFTDQEELLIILLMKICTKICHGPPMNLVCVIAFGNSLFHRWRKSLSPAFVFSLLWPASEAKARSSSVCQLLLRFWLVLFKKSYLSMGGYCREKISRYELYSTWTPRSTLRTGTAHTFSLTQDVCSDLVTKCQDSTLQKKQLSLWQDTETHKFGVTEGSRLLFRSTFWEQFLLPSVLRWFPSHLLGKASPALNGLYLIYHTMAFLKRSNLGWTIINILSLISPGFLAAASGVTHECGMIVINVGTDKAHNFWSLES